MATTQELPQVSCVDIKRLWYCDTTLVTEDVTGSFLATLLKKEGVSEIKNIHQETWLIEETEASQDAYRNQLTGNIYRMGKKTPGEVAAKFTIGQYDYKLKAAFMGGTVRADGKGWSRSRTTVDIYKTIIALTVDDQYCVFPYAAIKSNEANTDKAVGIAITATAMEPKNKSVDPEYWYDASEVVEPATPVA